MRNFKKWWAVVVVIASCLFMVATIDSKQLIENYNLAKQWVMSSPALEGSWSTLYPGEEPDGLSENKWLESPEQTVVDLSVNGNDISGIISTPEIREFADKAPMLVDYFLIEGHRSLFSHSFEARVYDYMGGKKSVFAVLHFTLKDGKLLMADKSTRRSDSMPQKAILIKRSDESFDKRLDAHIDDYAEGKVKKFRSLLDMLQDKNDVIKEGSAD